MFQGPILHRSNFRKAALVDRVDMHDIVYSIPVKHYPLTLNRYMVPAAI